MRKLPSPEHGRLRRALTVPNLLATLALATSLGGTAYAATVFTGLNIKDGTVTGVDVTNLSLTTMDFTSITRTQLRVKGDTGDTGPQGETGSTGAKGLKGDSGVPAPKAFTFQTLARDGRIGGAQVNPATSDFSYFSCSDADAAGDTLVGCTGPTGTPTAFPRWNYWCSHLGYSQNKHCKTTSLSVPQMSRTFLTVLVTADNPNGGLLNMPYNGTIVLNATATFFTQRSPSNQRLECQLQIARIENGIAQAPINVGAPIAQYRAISRTNINQQERLLNIGVSGAIQQTAGVFETWLACRAPDDDTNQNHRLEFIEGNMSVLSTRTNGQA